MKTKTISHDTSLVHGSHGIIDKENSKLPIIGTTISDKKLPEKIDMTEIMPKILDFLGI